MEQSGTVSAHLDAWTMEQLKKMATDEDRSVSWVIGFALKQFFVARQGKPGVARQIHIEDAIAAVVKRGPLKVRKPK
jgi:predicted transcriptional regulator